MITDVNQSVRHKVPKQLRVPLVLIALVVSWFITMAVIVRFIDTPSAVIVVAKNFQTLDPLGEDILLVRGGRHVFVVTSSTPGYVKRLYHAGAWLVLPALRNGCLDLTAIQRRVKTRSLDE